MTATRFLGFQPFFRKELTSWWQSRAALITFGAVGALATVGTLATRIDELAGGVPSPGMLNPTANVLGGQLEQWVTVAAILATIGALTQERATGTLAWTLSKPVSRSSVLLAKWAAGVAVLSIFSVVLPLAVSMGVATLAYGSVPDVVAVAKYGLVLTGIPAFFVALNLALATRIGSQAGIAAIAFAVFATPYFIGGFLPVITEVWPTSIGVMAGLIATGSAPNGPTVVGWAISIAVVGLAGLFVFDREDI
ncbi:MAG TPA: ABC transporter permease subunit [Candidatus Limnocylindrales bacterium]|jgi:ABC-2 type transport system permease protein